MATLGWIVVVLAVVAVAARLKSLLAPQAFPPWMTPMLEWGRNRQRVLERAGFREGERVLEIGPGAGWLTEGAAERVGERGRMVCLDLQIEMLHKVRARLGDTAALVCASGSLLPFRDGAFDRVFLAHVLGEIPDKRGACAEVFRVTRPGGELAVEEGLPDPDYIRRAALLRMLGAAGFREDACHGGWQLYTQRFARP